MTRRLFATTLAAAAGRVWVPPLSSFGRRCPSRARALSRGHRRLLGLPHARRIARRAGHEALSWRVGRRLRDSRRGRVRRREIATPDKETGLGDWTSEQIIAAIRTGKTPEGKDLSPVMPYAAFSHLTDADARGHRRLSQEPSAGQQQGQEFRPERARHGQRLRRAAARRLQRAAGAAEIAAGAAGDHFGRKSRPTPLLTN